VGRFKRGNRPIARHRGKGVEEFVQALAPFQIVDEIPQRDSRTHEHRYTAEDLGIAVNHFGGDRHCV
jgi:hypothetical protein